ncbi:FadR family transcriptional regulator [Candidatus Bipolaricaulota bacterium]|nr:FadR family transcriptional regulator [Candidatus Bipolaricaulota bacterium]
MNYEGELPRSMLAAQRKSAYVARWLIAAIREGRYKVGEKLPSERTLAEVLNVSRTAVREALSSLQMAGLVEPRVGDGNYVVGTVNGAVDVDEALEALEESGGLVEVWRIRRELEILIVRLAVGKAAPEDHASLKCALLKIQRAAEMGDVDEYLEANNQFHLSIAQAAKNPFLKRALFPLLEITDYQLGREISPQYLRDHAEELFKKHQTLAEAIAEKSLCTAVEAILDHFVASEEVFLGRGKEVITGRIGGRVGEDTRHLK